MTTPYQLLERLRGSERRLREEWRRIDMSDKHDALVVAEAKLEGAEAMYKLLYGEEE